MIPIELIDHFDKSHPVHKGEMESLKQKKSKEKCLIFVISTVPVDVVAPLNC